MKEGRDGGNKENNHSLICQTTNESSELKTPPSDKTNKFIVTVAGNAIVIGSKIQVNVWTRIGM